MTNETSRTHVVLIEDNPADVYLVRESLRVHKLDYRLTVFETFETAIDAVLLGSLRELDAILIDLNLRTGSGLDILNAIRRSEHLREAPVAILTSSDSPRDRHAAIELGANLYVRKPTDLDGFLQDVGSAIATLLGKAGQTAAAG